MPQVTPGLDGRDPWSEATAQGIGSAVAATRVSFDDELSDSSAGCGGRRPEAYPEVGQWVSPPAPKVPPPAPPISMSLPQQQQRAPAGATQNPWNDFSDRGNDPLRRIPWQQRENPGINERQMLRIQEGQELTGTNRRVRTDAETRRERETPGRCEVHHTTLPISSAHCRSARPIESIHMQAPHSTPSTMSQHHSSSRYVGCHQRRTSD